MVVIEDLNKLYTLMQVKVMPTFFKVFLCDPIYPLSLPLYHKLTH